MLQPLQGRSEEGWSDDSPVPESFSPAPPYTRLCHNAATESVRSARSWQSVSAGPTEGSWLLTLASAVSPYTQSFRQICHIGLKPARLCAVVFLN